MVPDFYDDQTMKPVEFSKLPAFLAKFPVDKACAASQPLLPQSCAPRPDQSSGSSTSTWHFMVCNALAMHGRSCGVLRH